MGSSMAGWDLLSLLFPYSPGQIIVTIRCRTCHIQFPREECFTGRGVCAAKSDEACVTGRIFKGKLWVGKGRRGGGRRQGDVSHGKKEGPSFTTVSLSPGVASISTHVIRHNEDRWGWLLGVGVYSYRISVLKSMKTTEEAMKVRGEAHCGQWRTFAWWSGEGSSFSWALAGIPGGWF